MDKYVQYVNDQGYTLYNTDTPGHKIFYITLKNNFSNKKSIILRQSTSDLVTFERNEHDKGFTLAHHKLSIDNIEMAIMREKAKLTAELGAING